MSKIDFIKFKDEIEKKRNIDVKSFEKEIPYSGSLLNPTTLDKLKNELRKGFNMDRNIVIELLKKIIEIF